MEKLEKFLNRIFFFSFLSGQPTEKTLTYAKYPYSKYREYTFEIVSVNEIGNSSKSSHVFVPKFESKLTVENK